MASTNGNFRWHSAIRRAVASVIALGALFLAAPLNAQVTGVTATTPALLPVGYWGSPSAVAAAATNTLTIRINSGASQSIKSVVDNVVNAFPSPVSVTTEWRLSATTTIDLVAYFPSPASALVAGSIFIPSSLIAGRMRTGRPTVFTPFTESGVGGIGAVGGSLHLFRQSVVGGVNLTGQRTDNLDLQLDLRGTSMTAGTYHGTLALRAIAY